MKETAACSETTVLQDHDSKARPLIASTETFSRHESWTASPDRGTSPDRGNRGHNTDRRTPGRAWSAGATTANCERDTTGENDTITRSLNERQQPAQRVRLQPAGGSLLERLFVNETTARRE